MRAVSSMATRHLLADLTVAAAEVGLPRVHIESTGGVEAARRVAEGEGFDLVFLAAGALSALAAQGHVDDDSLTPLVISQVAVAVPAGGAGRAERPDEAAFADAAGVRDALRSAARVGYSTGPSGTALLEMIRAWGLTDAVGPKLLQAHPGVPVAQLLAQGSVDLGFQQLSELVGQPGIRVTGVLPDDCAIDTVFSGAVSRSSNDPGAARAVLEFFASPEASAIAIAHSFHAASAS